MKKLMEIVEKAYIKENKVSFRVGDTVRVSSKIIEGTKERIQDLEGIILKMHGGGATQTFTVRKVVAGLGIEKTFFMNSPLITKIQVLRKGKVRRAKLFYLRDRIGTKAIRIKDKETNKTEE